MRTYSTARIVLVSVVLANLGSTHGYVLMPELPTKELFPVQLVEETGGEPADIRLPRRPPPNHPGTPPAFGLLAEYFNPREPIESSRLRYDANLQWEWGEMAPAEGIKETGFGVRWTGSLRNPEVAIEQFQVTASGSVRFWMNGELIYERWPEWEVQPRSVKIPLLKTKVVPIAIEYNHRPGTGPPAFHLAWQLQGQDVQPIPSQYLLPPKSRAPAIPVYSLISPVSVEILRFADQETLITADGKPLPARLLGDDTLTVEVPLRASSPTTVAIPGWDLSHGVTWRPMRFEQLDQLILRAGDSVLMVDERLASVSLRKRLENGREEPVLKMKVEGATALPFHQPGRITVSAFDKTGKRLGKASVTVFGSKPAPRRVAHVTAASRLSFDVELEPNEIPLFLTGHGGVTVGKVVRNERSVSAQFSVFRRGTPTIAMRLGSASGPILLRQPIEEFTITAPFLRSAPIDQESRRGRAYIRMEPFIPGIMVALDFNQSGALVGEDQTEIHTVTHQSVTSIGTRGFHRRTDIRRGELVAEWPFTYKLPPERDTFCWEWQWYELDDTVPKGSYREIPVCYPPWVPENTCQIVGYRSLVFSQARNVDPENRSENEVQPAYADFEEAGQRCTLPPLPDQRNPEYWIPRHWHLVTREFPGAGGVPQDDPGYLVVLSEAEPFRGRLDNPLDAVFAHSSPQPTGGEKLSLCKACDGNCDPVEPEVSSGTLPGLYTTGFLPCEEESSSGNGSGSSSSGGEVETIELEEPTFGGMFWVSKLDAHGLQDNTDDKFPDYVEVLPKRSGSVVAPVIQIDKGGDGAVNDCSLYGNVCMPHIEPWYDGLSDPCGTVGAVAGTSTTGTATGVGTPTISGSTTTTSSSPPPSTNTWEFTAVARSLTDGQDVPPGHRIEWDGFPDGYIVRETLRGQPWKIKASFPPGRHFPVLRVYGPHPSGGGEMLLGKAEIHSIVVEERPTCDAPLKNPDVAPGTRQGTAFHLTNHIGRRAPIQVDTRLGILGQPDRYPGLDVRGRVSLDGYPQNEYWVTDQDSGDLPQVVGVPPNQHLIFYLQGYQLASRTQDALTLAVQGQAQLEKCSSGWFFRDCTPCSQSPPPRYPVNVTWQESDREPFDSSFPIELIHDEPAMDKDEGETPDRSYVFTDNVDDDFLGGGSDKGYYIDKGYEGRVNFFAAVPWSSRRVHADYIKEVPPDDRLRIRWRVEGLRNLRRGPLHCQAPTLRDLFQAGMAPDDSGAIDAVLSGLTSRIQLDYTAGRGGDKVAKAGDLLCLLATSKQAHPAQGERFWKAHEVEIVSGDKGFHIVVPNKPTRRQRAQIASFDPFTIFDLSRDELKDSVYKDWKWEAPVNSNESSVMEIYFFDKHGNVLAEDTPIRFSLDGGGKLAGLDPANADHPEKNHIQALSTKLNGRGKATLRYTSDRYGTCPWQVVEEHSPATIYAIIDGTMHMANYSMVTSDESLPTPFPPILISMEHTTRGSRPDPQHRGRDLLDMARGATAKITTTVTRDGIPLEDVAVAFTSLNGDLIGGGAKNILKTNARGKAVVHLTSRNARLDHDGWGSILVTAAVGSSRASIGSFPAGPGTIAPRSLPRWIDSSPTSISVLNSALATDVQGTEHIDVEMIGGTFRATVQNWTYVIVNSRPHHRMRMEISSPAGVIQPTGSTVTTGAAAAAVSHLHLPFDVIDQTTTPEVRQGHDAEVSHLQVDSDRAVGTGSLYFSGNGSARIPNNTAVDAVGGIEIRLWLQPERTHAGILLERKDQYRLEILTNARLRLTTYRGSIPTAQITSDVPVAVQRWTYVECRISENLAKLSVGRTPDRLNSVYASTPPQTLTAGSEPATLGSGFIGRLDDVHFLKGGFSPSGVQALLVGAGGSPVDGTVPAVNALGSGAPPNMPPVAGQLGTNGEFTTDADGRFVFVFAINPRAPNDYRPIEYRIRVFGSEEASASVWGIPKIILADLQAIGSAFLKGDEGLGSDASTGERIAAWASEMIPFVADLRTLGFEIYKAATGCDEVSWMNVTFATAGLVADTVSFGTAGTAIRGAKLMLKTAGRMLLKEVGENAASDAAMRMAMEGFMRFTTMEVATADGTPQQVPKPWVQDAGHFMNALKTGIGQGLTQIYNEAFRSTDDVFKGLQVFSEIGASGLLSTLHRIETLRADLGLVRLDDMDEHGFGGSFADLLDTPVDLLVESRFGRARRAVRSAAEQEKLTEGIIDALGQHLPHLNMSDTKVRDGLTKMVGAVVKQGNVGENVKRLTHRMNRALSRFDPDSQAKILKDFDDLYDAAKALDSKIFEEVQSVARDFAARGRSARASKSRTKGAALALQESRDAIKSNPVRLVEIEPKAPRDAQGNRIDNRLFRDALEDDPTHGLVYVELKAYTNVNNSSSKFKAQINKHFERHPKNTSPGDMKPVVYRYTGVGMTDATKDKIIDGAVESLSKRHGWDPDSARDWAKKNIHFEQTDLRYTLL